MDQNNKRKRMKLEEVASSMIIVDDGNVPQSCEALAQVQRPATPTTSIGRLKISGVSEAQPYHGGDGDGADDDDDDAMEFPLFYSSGQLIELCTQYNVLGEDQQTNKDMLRKLVIESAAAKAGRIFPAELPNYIQVMVLYCARQNGFTEPKLAQEAVPKENAQFPESLLRFPQQVEYLETPLARTRDFFCNYRFCHHSEDRRVCLKEIFHGHCSGCDNLLHKGCGNCDTSNISLRVCGWCSGSIDEYEQQDQLMREMEGQYYDERQLHGVQRVFKFDTIPLDQFQSSGLNRSRVQCYICNEELWLPKHIAFPFHRAYSGFVGKSKDRPDTARTARKRKEYSARTVLVAHNAKLHKVGFGEEQIEVPMFEAFKKAELPLTARTYAASFAEVRLEASQLTDDPFNDCTLYFTRWGTYIETDGEKLAAKELRTEQESRKKGGREMSVRKAKGERRKEVKTLLDTVSGVVTKVVDAVKELLLEERMKPDANFVNQVFQERLRQCIANSSTELGCQREAFLIACMIQRRMLALPLLHKEVKERCR
eukprot:scaffold4756_cov88-Cylindrotheca_fusiformis.AAC.3